MVRREAYLCVPRTPRAMVTCWAFLCVPRNPRGAMVTVLGVPVCSPEPPPAPPS